MKYWEVIWVHLSVLLATVSACHRRLDMEALLADNPRANIDRRESPEPYYEHGEKHIIGPRGEHIIYKQATTPKTVILIQPHPESLPPPGGPLPALLPNIPKHFSKHLRHAHRFLRHRTKKLHKFFRHFLGDELPPHLHPGHGPIPYEHGPPLPPHPPPAPLKFGVPAVKVEAYQEEPPKIVRVVHRHPTGEPGVIKYVEAPKVVKVVESYGPNPKEVVKVVGGHPPPPFPPKEIVKFVGEPEPPGEIVKYIKTHHHHHHGPPTPLPPPTPSKIVKYIEEHHHHEAPLPPPLPPPSPTPIIYERSPSPGPSLPPPSPTKIVRYVETVETDGSKTVRVVGDNPFRHHPPPPPPPLPPAPPLPVARAVGGTKTRITILHGDDDREPPIVYRDRVPAGPTPTPIVFQGGPPPPPAPTHFAPPPPPAPSPSPRPEPVIYSKGASGAGSPHALPFQPVARAVQVPQPHFVQTAPVAVTPQPSPQPIAITPQHIPQQIAVTPQPLAIPRPQVTPTPYPAVSPTPYPAAHPSPYPQVSPSPQPIYQPNHHPPPPPPVPVQPQQPYFPSPSPPPAHPQHSQYPVPSSFSNFQHHNSQFFGSPPFQPQSQPPPYGGPPPPQSPYGQSQAFSPNGLYNSLPFQPDGSSIYQ